MSTTTDNFKPDYKIVAISSLGLAGLFIAVILLSQEGKNSPKGEKTGSVFHEIGFSPRNFVGRALDYVVDSLSHVTDSNRRERQDCLNSLKSVKDSAGKVSTQAAIDKLSAQIKSDSTSIEALKTSKGSYEDSVITGTAALPATGRWLHFQFTPDDVVIWNLLYDSLRKDWCVNVPYRAKFTAGSRNFYYHGNVDFNVVSYSGNMQFIEKYPAAGAWIFLQLLFVTFCCIAGAAAVYTRGQVIGMFEGQTKKPEEAAYWISAVVVAFLLVALDYVLAGTFIDEMPVKGLFFIRTLPTILFCMNFVGWIAGALCLAGFIHSTSMLGHFATQINDKARYILQQRVTVNQAVDGEKTTAQGDLKTAESEHTEFKDRYLRLLGFFHRYFILSSILLSLGVLCIGSLYNMANSLNFVKLLTATWGFSPAGGDAVYLYGGLYTAILLLIYLPAKMEFGDVRLRLPPEQRFDDAEDDSKLFSLLEQPFSLLKGGLIAATPFLTGVIDAMFNGFFKH